LPGSPLGRPENGSQPKLVVSVFAVDLVPLVIVAVVDLYGAKGAAERDPRATSSTRPSITPSDTSNGQVHTNGIENFWSLLKRGLHGTYISVEPFHLFRYLDERVFTYNLRGTNDYGRFEHVMDAVTGRRLTYAELTAQP
jgi:ISXO2-like transposase domain